MIETWKDRPLSELSKEELIDALNSLYSLMEEQRASHMSFVNTFHGDLMASSKHKSFFQWLFGARKLN